MNILIFGFGYSAAALAQKLAKEGWNIFGTSRDAEKRARYKKSGYTLVDFTESEIGRVLPDITHILISTSQRKEESDPVLTRFSALLEYHASRLKWIGYLSTTGVYGDHKGNWVDETTPIIPASWRIKGRFESENAWREFGRLHHIPVLVFRLAGIYGPRRNALRQLQEGKPYSIYKEGQVFSRIHVEDIAHIVAASLQKPQAQGIYNICDDEPAPSHEVLEYAAQLLEIPAPVRTAYDKASLSEMAKDFYGNNRRVRNTKFKQEFETGLLYPNYRAGLESLFDAGQY